MLIENNKNEKTKRRVFMHNYTILIKSKHHKCTEKLNKEYLTKELITANNKIN